MSEDKKIYGTALDPMRQEGFILDSSELTKREQIALKFVNTLLTIPKTELSMEDCVIAGVAMADLFIKKLER